MGGGYSRKGYLFESILNILWIEEGAPLLFRRNPAIITKIFGEKLTLNVYVDGFAEAYTCTVSIRSEHLSSPNTNTFFSWYIWGVLVYLKESGKWIPHVMDLNWDSLDMNRIKRPVPLYIQSIEEYCVLKDFQEGSRDITVTMENGVELTMNREQATLPPVRGWLRYKMHKASY